MKNIIRKKIALITIFLVVMLPFYSSSVFADLASINAHGQDNKNNFIREEDFINFKAVASLTGNQTVAPGQVLLGSDLAFDSCKPGISGFDCELRFPSNGTDFFDSVALPYTITLKDSAGSIVDTKSDTIFVDNLPPKMDSFELESLGSGSIVFDFEISDAACSAAECFGKCSGISSLMLFELDSGFEENIDINVDSCSFAGTHELATSSFSEGEHTVLAKAFDKLGQESSDLSVTFSIDSSPPFIKVSTFKIVDETDEEINFFGPSPVPVVIEVEVFDQSLDSALADFTGLGGPRNMQAACTDSPNETITCSWNINLNPTGEGTKTIFINASDLSGNEAGAVVSKDLSLDNVGPVATSLKSAKVVDEQSFAKLSGNEFIATFRETGVGLSNNDVKLHAGSLVLEADECSKAPDGWQCTWNKVNFKNSGTATVSIGADTKDRLGNALTASFSENVIVDNTQPKLIKVNITNIGGAESSFENFPKTGDKLNIKAAVEDDSIEMAVADLSSFIVNAGNVSADSCIKTSDNIFVCSWTTKSIDVEGFINGVIAFEFTDVSGNVLSVQENLKVFGTSGVEAPDFFDSSVKCSPNLLDRETLPLANQRAFCMVTLKPKSLLNEVGTFSNLTTLSIALRECQGETDLVESFGILNNGIGSLEPVIRVNFRKTDADVNEVGLLCSLDIISKKGNVINTVPEQENVDLKFGFYNLPLGEISDSVQKKIDDAVEDADNALKVATWLKKIFFYAEKICNIGNTLANVIVIFKVIGNFNAVWDKLTEGTPANPPAKAKRITWDEATEEFRQQVLDWYPDFIIQTCNFVNCKVVLQKEGSSPTFSFEGPDGILGGWRAWGQSIINSLDIGDLIKNYVGKDGKPAEVSERLNPKDSIAVSALTACIPGIIYGIDKYRQIQCMYADCLQNGVGKQGLPVFACEDQKAYATCKYVVGEVFSIIPYTVIFDKFMNLIKETLANPFKLLGATISIACNPRIAEPFSYHFCAVAEILNFLGVTIKEVTAIFDSDTWTIHDDFCDRIDTDDLNEDE